MDAGAWFIAFYLMGVGVGLLLSGVRAVGGRR